MDLGLAYVLLTTVVTLIVEVLRSKLAFLDGRLVNLAAWAVGYGATYAPIDAFADVKDFEARLATGLMLAGASSALAELKKLMVTTREYKSAALDHLVRAGTVETAEEEVRRYDEGYNKGDYGNVTPGEFDPKNQPPTS